MPLKVLSIIEFIVNQFVLLLRTPSAGVGVRLSDFKMYTEGFSVVGNERRCFNIYLYMLIEENISTEYMHNCF